MADIGEIRAKLVAETEQFETGMRRAATATEKFSSDAEKSLDEVNSSLKGLKWAEAGQGIARMGAALRGIGSEFAEAAGNADDLADSLRGAFGDSADQVAAWSQQVGTAFGVFSAEQVGGAAVALQKFGQASEANLRRVADVAAGSGQSIDSIATAFGKFEKFGDARSILALQKAVGATNAELAGFGAALDSSGKILTDTPARVDAARAAMEQLLDEKFGGAMERQSDASARLAGSMELLKQEMGASAHELKEQLAPGMLDLVNTVRGLNPELLGLVGLVTEFGGGALSMAGGAIESAAHLKSLGLSVTGLKTAIAAIPGLLSTMAAGLVAVSGPALILIGTFGALAVGLAAYTAELQKANKAAEELLNTETKRLKGYADNKDLIGKNAAEIKAAGKGLKEVDQLIAGLQDQLERGRTEGLPQAQMDKISERLAQARAARGDLLKDQKSPVYNKPEPTPGGQAPKVEESEKQRIAREKREASEAAKAERKRLAAEKKAEREREASRKRAEAKARQDEAKRERERQKQQRKAERDRAAAEREAKKQQQQAQRDAARTAKQQAAKPAASSSQAAQAAQARAEKPGFFGQFGDREDKLDPATAAFRAKSARNAALAQSGVILDGRPTKGAGLMDAALAAIGGATGVSAEVASRARPGTAGKPPTGADKAAEAVKDALDEITIVLEVRDGSRSQRLSGSGKPGKPVKFDVSTPLGGVTG